MATIDKSTNLTSDVYGINSYVNTIKKNFTPGVNEDTLMLGIFGYMGQMFSDLLQNSVVMASEFSNESIPTKAKFEKNIIAHALGLGITDINAVPAQMDVLLTFIEDDIIRWYKNLSDDSEYKNSDDNVTWEFIFDKDTPIHIGDFVFYADYDIQIRKIKLENTNSENNYAYTAKYLIDIDNPISDVTNPYLTSPVKMRVNGNNVIFTKCTLHQVERTTVHKKVLSDNSIASKTLTFDFEGQLAAFTIDVTEGDTTTHLIPVYEGLSVESRKYPYFYYSYLDSKTIRIKFDRSSYAPRINSDVQINIQTTEGESGNFTFSPESYPGFSFESEKYGYNNIACEIRPVTGESAYGSDKKSVDDLKKLIPKEALSRGSITNISDLENFFNMLNTDYSMLYFYKKRDNALERLYYSYIIMKDEYNNIVPTNTVDVIAYPDQLQTEENSGKYVFKKGEILKLQDQYAYIVDADTITNDAQEFKYCIPYNFIINESPLYGMYYLSTIDSNKFLDFSYINEKCVYQYIATSINWYRGYINNPNTYEMTISAEQNVDTPDGFDMVEYDDDGNIISSKVRCIAVFYDDEDKPHRWAEGTLIGFNSSANIYSFKFEFTTEDSIDVDNRIRINTGLYDVNSTNESYAYMHSNTKCVIHFLYDDGDTGTGLTDIERLNKLNEVLPDLSSSTILSNSYTVSEGVDFFYDYSEIVNSVVIAEQDESGNNCFRIKNVPVVKYDYFDSEDKVVYFCKELVKRKNYIDYALQVLEDAFGMDFKFFNTYGPSTLFTIDNEASYLNRTNLSLTFKVKLAANYDTNIINDITSDIKSYIENINEISSLHMPNLITEITNTYRESIVYFEFVDMNGYGPGVQHLYSMGMPDELKVPEFLNINIVTKEDGTSVPDIQLIQM